MQHFDDITHLYFDLDDTLWDFSVNSRIGLRCVYEHYALDGYFSGFDHYYDIYSKKNTSLWEAYGRGEIDKGYLSCERFAYPLRCVGASEQRALEMGHYFVERTSEQTCLVDGAIALLERLKDKYTLGILSNGFVEAQYKKLELTGLSSYFDEVILSEGVGSMKPERLIFECAERAFGVSGSSILMIGDNWVSDIEGALAAGWKAIYLDRRSAKSSLKGKGVWQVSHLKQVGDLLLGVQ